MQTIYKGKITGYNGKDFGGFAIINNEFLIEDFNAGRINWKYSPKKNMKYARKVLDNGRMKYHFILFKNDYMIIHGQKSKKAYEEKKEGYYDNKGKEVENTEEIPF